MNSSDLLIKALLLALAVFGHVRAVRALEWVSRRVRDDLKPWSCDVCMGFWSTCAWSPIVALVLLDWGWLVAAPASYGIVLVIFNLMKKTEPPTLPDLPPLPPGE